MNSLGSRRKAATWACWVSAALMAVIALYMLYIAFDVAAYTVSSWDIKNARAAMAYKTAMATARAVVFLLLAAFFFHFGRGVAPFGIGQSVRLAFVGLITGAYGVVGEFVPNWINHLPKVMFTIESISTDFEYPGSWLLFVAFGIFLICLSAVFRYGDALLEDSDNIL